MTNAAADRATCTADYHDLLRADPDLFRRSTLPGWTVDDGEEFQEHAHCAECHSTIALCSPSRRAR